MTSRAEQHDEWAEMRRYIGIEVLAKARKEPTANDLETHPPGSHSNPGPRGLESNPSEGNEWITRTPHWT